MSRTPLSKNNAGSTATGSGDNVTKLRRGKRLMDGLYLPTRQEEADNENFRSGRFPTYAELEMVEEPDAAPSMALYVLAGRRMVL